jgi:hypothetical protein
MKFQECIERFHWKILGFKNDHFVVCKETFPLQEWSFKNVVQALVSKLKQCIAKVQLTNLKSQKCSASSIGEFEISRTTSFLQYHFSGLQRNTSITRMRSKEHCASFSF